MDRYANFLIVVTRVTNWFDDSETELARISTAGQIRVGHAVRVVPSRARGLRRETVAAMTVSRNGRRALLGGSVDIGRKYLSMPVHGFFDAGLIEDTHRDWLAFYEPQYRARHETVVANGLDDLPGPISSEVLVIRSLKSPLMSLPSPAAWAARGSKEESPAAANPDNFKNSRRSITSP